ncbi:MAG: lipase [Rariglobus sp.]|jgi:acetyl esterase/lipase|nr:lipase [Rariglobus sp.]
MSPIRLLAIVLIVPGLLVAQEARPKPAAASYTTETDLFYHEGPAAEKAGDYQRSQCRLDLYFPENRPGFATVIWLHGGGLIGGRRAFPQLKDKELGLVAVSYRLSPQAEFPAFLEDAAAATAWTLRHIAERGGDPTKVFLAGHSAGGYLAAMVGMDPRWLAAHGLSHRQLAGLILVSAQVTTHFEVKKLLGDTGPELRPIIDRHAPLYHASKDLPPICLITGDRKIEYKNRVEENDLLATSLRNLGHPAVEFHEMGGLDHGMSRHGAWILIPGFIKKTAGRNLPPAPAP